MAVGSITSSNVRPFLQHRFHPGIMAPGSNIYSTTYNGAMDYERHIHGLPSCGRGGSPGMSAKPSLTNVQLRNALNETANDMWHDPAPWQRSCGRLGTYQYVTSGMIPRSRDPDPDPQYLNVSISTITVITIRNHAHDSHG